MDAIKRDHLIMVFLTAMILIFGSYVSSFSIKNDSPYLYIIEAEIDQELCEEITCEYNYLPGEYVLSRDSIEKLNEIKAIENIYFADYFPSNFYNDGTFIETETIVTLNEPIINDKFLPIKKVDDLYTFMSVDMPKDFYEKNGNVELSYYSYQYLNYDFSRNDNGYTEITIPIRFAKQFNVTAGDIIDLNVIKRNKNEQQNTTQKYYIRAIFDSTHAPFDLHNKIFVNKVNTDIIYDKDIITEVYKKRFLDVSNGDIKNDNEHNLFLKDFKSFTSVNDTDITKAYVVTTNKEDIMTELRNLFPYNKISKKSLFESVDIYTLVLFISIFCFSASVLIIKSYKPFKVMLDSLVVYFVLMFVQYIYIGNTFKINYKICLSMLLILYVINYVKKRRYK